MSHRGKGGEKKRGETRGVEEGWSNHSPRALSLVRISPLTWLSPSSHRHLPLCSPSEPETRSQTPRTTPIPLPLLCLGEEEGACLHVRRRQTEAEDACEGLGEEESAICGCVRLCVRERERAMEVLKSDGFLFCLYPGGERDPQAAASSRYMQQEAVR